jgi:hypothetical protein
VIEDRPQLLAGAEVVAIAVLDRLLHHSHAPSSKERSYRPRDFEHAVGLGW